MRRSALGVVPLWIAAAHLGCAREPGVSVHRARLIAAGAVPTGFEACLAGVLPGGAHPQADWIAVARAARAVEENGAADPGARARDLALLEAAADDLEGALARLDAAGPRRDDPWCDAERAAYLAELGERDEDPEALLAAVAAADQALARAPELSIARCNRALAIERLALPVEARRTWRALLAHGVPKPLREVAERRLAALDAAPTAQRWKDLATRLEISPESVPRAEVEEAARRWPLAVRQVGLEVLLRRAAEASLRGEPAEAHLAAAAELGELLAGPGGDASLSRATAEVLQAIAADQAGRAFLEGVAAYGRGRELRRADRFSDAASELADAADRLNARDSAFGAWARYMAAATRWFAASDVAERDTIDWDQLRRQTPSDLPSLAASVSWSAGVAADYTADLPAALLHFDAAVRAFEELHDAESEAWVRVLRAFVLYDLGRDREAGRDFLRAMRHRDRIASDTTLELLIDGWIDQIVSPRWPSLLAPYHEELLEVARASGNPARLIQAHLVRGEDPSGVPEDRLRHLDAALEAVRSLQDPPDRPQQLALILAARSKILLETDPLAALETVDAALAELEAQGLGPLRLPALRTKAEALRALGRLDEAEAALLAAVDLLRGIQVRARSVEERMRTLLDAQSLFEDLAELRLLDRHDSDGAFEAVELGRAGSLLARAGTLTLRGEEWESEPARLAEHLPPDVQLVEFAFVDQELAIWHLSDSGARFALVAADRAAMREAAERLAVALAEGRDEAAAQSVELGRQLLAPVQSWLERDVRLAVVPDPALAAVPWSALIEPETGRPLIVSRPVVVAPSARWVARWAGRGVAGRRVASVRALGDAALAPNLFPTLAALPAARAEATAVASLYRQAELLLGGRATVEAAIRAPLPDVLHLAAHGLVPSNATAHVALVLAPDGGHADGLLSAAEVAERALDGVGLVVLPACTSAGGPVLGSEGILSLATAFLTAGVPAVVATHWPVEDAATQEIMVALHRGVTSGLAPSEALRRAQLDLLETRRLGPSIWAGFAAWGVR